jgi:hypothetical protein
VAALVVVTLILRLAYLMSPRSDGFVWSDIDQDLANGATLVRDGHFAWTWQPVA